MQLKGGEIFLSHILEVSVSASSIGSRRKGHGGRIWGGKRSSHVSQEVEKVKGRLGRELYPSAHARKDLPLQTTSHLLTVSQL